MNWTRDLFRYIERVAVEGKRMPSGEALRLIGFGSHPKVIHALVYRGDIKVEIYGGNWRVVEILTGKNAGARTMEHPKGAEPWSVVDKASLGDIDEAWKLIISQDEADRFLEAERVLEHVAHWMSLLAAGQATDHDVVEAIRAMPGPWSAGPNLIE